MIPKFAEGGSSFKGAAAYYLHDKKGSDGLQPDSSERVAWTQTVNLPTDDPERAWRMMAHTALARMTIKDVAGGTRSGRKLEKPVFAVSLSWHPDESPTKEEQLEAAHEFMAALGIAEHQAIIVAHNDEPHAHVHILINRVHPMTGIAAKLSRSKLIASSWAQAHEERGGRIFCEERVVNNARRSKRRQGLASDNRKSRRIAFEAARRGQEEADRSADRLMQDTPALSLADLTRQRSTFTRQDLVRLVGRYAKSGAIFQAVMRKLEASPELRRVGKDRTGRDRFTTATQLDIERSMALHAVRLYSRRDGKGAIAPKLAGQTLCDEQRQALDHLLAPPCLATVIGFAGAGKSTLMAAARQSFEAAGYRVTGAALSSIAADGLSAGAGIDSRTIHSRLYQWERGQNRMTENDVLIVDEAGMIGSRQMERLLFFAAEAGARVVLLGDTEQLQAIEAGAAFRAIAERVPPARLQTVRRQRETWQQDATRELATGQTAAALRRYEQAGMLHAHGATGDAMAGIVEAWHRHRAARPDESQIILAYAKADVRALNDLARDYLRKDGSLGPDRAMYTHAGPRSFAAGDRVYFLKNDRGLGVSNGSLGTVEAFSGRAMTVRLDNGRSVTFNPADYRHLDHGYAATIHKSQGVTVDRAHLLASPRLDRHAAYVALSRHRDRVDLHYATDGISRTRLDAILSRDGAKDTSLDYDEARRPSADWRAAAGPPAPPVLSEFLTAFIKGKNRPSAAFAAAKEYGRMLRPQKDQSLNSSRLRPPASSKVSHFGGLPRPAHSSPSGPR